MRHSEHSPAIHNVEMPGLTPSLDHVESDPNRRSVALPLLLPGTLVTLHTRNTCYRLVVIDGTERRVQISGGKLFPENTDVEFDAEEMTGFIPIHTYPAQTAAMPSEVGAYRNIRFVTSTQAKVFPSAGNNVTSGHKTTDTTKEDVYCTLIFGMNAYGIVPLSGHSLENIVTPPGGQGDPLKQRSTSGWKAMTTAIILNDAFMTRLETGATA